MIEDIFQKVVVTLVSTIAAWVCTLVPQKFYKKLEISYPAYIKKRSASQIKGQYIFIFSNLILVFLLLYYEYLGPRYFQSFSDLKTETLISGHHWITYDPIPQNTGQNTKFDLCQINREVNWIKKAGFDGIITFSCQKYMIELSKAAKENQLKIIVGIWNPLDPIEVGRAMSLSEYADAYCVGHDGLIDKYTFKELSKTINNIRFHTKRPVSTTECLSRYIREKDDKRLLLIGDWLFPDTQITIEDKADAIRGAQETVLWTNELAEAAKGLYKPILFKMVSYPIKNYSSTMEQQKNFYAYLSKSQEGVMPNIPKTVSISVNSAFDLPWIEGWPLYTCYPFSGLISNDGNPRPAAKEIVKSLH